MEEDNPATNNVISPKPTRRVARQECELLEHQVEIPDFEDENPKFSFRKLWAFTGPGFLMSIAYLDPGNIESDLQSGAIAKYRLIWVLLLAHFIGFLLQRLSARLGVVAGKHMAEMAYEFYPRIPRIFLWIMIEIAIIGSDMQEVIGTSIAIYLLSRGKIPLYGGVLITIVDTFTFLFIDNYGFRKLEMFFGFLITVMAVTFGYEYFIDIPNQIDMAKGLIPFYDSYNSKMILQIVSIIGAVIMPHNLYLHSALVRSRKIIREVKEKVTEANYYFFLESGVALTVSFVINLFVMAVMGNGMYMKTNNEIRQECDKQEYVLDPNVFPRNNETVDADIYKAGMFLACSFGPAALYIWAIGILAAGQSSTMTGTYAGQFVMEGFLNIAWPKWKRVIFTRSIAIIPTLSVALVAKSIDHLTGMNDILNCVQMLQLPFALIPIITFTSHPNIMFEYKNGSAFKVFSLLISAVAICINLTFFTFYIISTLGTSWYVIIPFVILGIAYLSFVVYLNIVCLISMGIIKQQVIQKWLKYEKLEDDIAPWKVKNSEQILSTDDQ
uniref:Protein Malvolio n=1 Tax=Parastrongyloides trichosuri TaxID=131310 RepID=A0A0N4Z1R3_PARTI